MIYKKSIWIFFWHMIVENLVCGDRLALVISAAYFFINCIKVTFSYSISRSILHHQLICKDEVFQNFAYLAKKIIEENVY